MFKIIAALSAAASIGTVAVAGPDILPFVDSTEESNTSVEVDGEAGVDLGDIELPSIQLGGSGSAQAEASSN